jgi:hypothetical protein
VVSLEGLERQLLLGLYPLLPQLINLGGEDGFGCGGRVNAVGLDGHDDASADLEEHVGVQADNTGLVGLGNVGEDAVNHADEHAVLHGVTCVLCETLAEAPITVLMTLHTNDGNNICSVGRHVYQITT